MAPSSTASQFMYGVRVEGLGDSAAAAADQRICWTWGRDFLEDAATADPDGLYVDGLMRWPDEIGVTVDWLNGSVGESEQTVRIRGGTLIWNDLCKYGVDYSGKLAAAITATGTSIQLTEGGLASGTIIFLEREAIELGAEAPAGQYVCIRGVFSTMKAAHGIDLGDDTEYFRPSMHPSTIIGRFVNLVKIPFGSTGYSDEVPVWTGVIREVSFPQPAVVELQVSSAMEYVKSRLIARKQWEADVTWFPGQQMFLAMDSQPFAGARNASKRAVVMIDDEGTALARWRVQGNRTYLGGYYNPQFTDWLPFADNPVPKVEWDEYEPSLHKVREVITSHRDQPSNDTPVADNTLPLSQVPHKLILQLLLSTENGGDPGANHATYDTGVDMIAGCVPADIVDVAQIEEWGLRHGGVVLDRVNIGMSGKPEKLYEVIQDKILGPLGAVLSSGQTGLVSVLQMTDVIGWGESVTTITADDLVQFEDGEAPKILQSRRLAEGLDSIVVKWRDPLNGGDPRKIKANDAINRRRAVLGSQNKKEVDASFITDEMVAWSLVVQTIARWHVPIPLVAIETLRTVDHWPGQIVGISNDLMMGASGARGLTGARGIISARQHMHDERANYIAYELRLVGLLYERDEAFISPAADVVSWGDPWVTISVNEYTDPNDPDGATKDVAPFTAGDIVQICNKNGSVRDAVVTVEEVDVPGDRLRLSGVGVVPVATDVIMFAAYGSCTQDQKDKWAFICNAAGLLVLDNPKRWSMS